MPNLSGTAVDENVLADTTQRVAQILSGVPTQSMPAIPTVTSGFRDERSPVWARLREFGPTTAAAGADLVAARRVASHTTPEREPLPAYLVDGLEKWEGTVEHIFDRAFLATLHRTLGEASPEIQAEFPMNLVPLSDRDMMSDGATFYMTVRTILSPRGDPRRTASIRMRRAGRWSAQEIERMKIEAEELVTRVAGLFQ